MSQKTAHGYHFTLEPNRSEKGAENQNHIQTQLMETIISPKANTKP